MTKIGKLE